MATELLRNRLRRDIGADIDSLPDVDADLIFAEAAELYGDNAAAASAYARVIALRGIMANAARLVSYRQNQTSENASDIYKHLRDLLDFWRGELVEAEGLPTSVAKFGGLRSKPARVKEYPARSSMHMPGLP